MNTTPMKEDLDMLKRKNKEIDSIVVVSKHRPHDHDPSNPYSVLGISNSANSFKIKMAYKELAKKFHPDKGVGNEKFFDLITKAKKALLDPEIRELYDNHGIFNIEVSDSVMEKRAIFLIRGLMEAAVGEVDPVKEDFVGFVSKKIVEEMEACKKAIKTAENSIRLSNEVVDRWKAEEEKFQEYLLEPFKSHVEKCLSSIAERREEVMICMEAMELIKKMSYENEEPPVEISVSGGFRRSGFNCGILNG